MMTNDWLAESGDLFLGSRLKRLGEQLQSDVNRVSQRAGVPVQPGQFPLLGLLSQRGPQTVGELARAMGLSQPVTTRNIARLVQSDLVQMGASAADGRSKIVALTRSGERAIDRARRTLWPHVEAAVRQIVDGLSGPLLTQIGQLEHALTERSLAERAASIAARELVPAQDADIPAIAALMNRAYRGSAASAGWNTEAGYISGDRTTAALLRAEVAAKPHATLLTWPDRRDDTLQGCVWLEPRGDGTWYLGSLAVDPRRQNGGLGHSLLGSAEQWMRERGAKRVRISVVNVRLTLIEWYVRRDYHETGETAPFPYDDDRFGTPQRDDLEFVVLEKDLTRTRAVG